jgi:hypothetical protein
MAPQHSEWVNPSPFGLFPKLGFIIHLTIATPVQRSVRTQIEGQFGWLRVDGRKYESDVIIHADGQVTERNCGCSPALRAQLSPTYVNDYFHTPLAEWELDFLEREAPEVVIVGAGFKSMLPITPKAREVLSNYELRVRSTQEAIALVNGEERRFVAILHLSC